LVPNWNPRIGLVKKTSLVEDTIERDFGNRIFGLEVVVGLLVLYQIIGAY